MLMVFVCRKRRFKRMAVDPEPPQAQIVENGENQLTLHPTQNGFSFSTFASSSIFAKPRQRKIKKKAIRINKYSMQKVNLFV